MAAPLPGSSGRASRPNGGTSTWDYLNATLSVGDGIVRLDTKQPPTGGPQSTCDIVEAPPAECNRLPPGALEAKLCEGSFNAGAEAFIDVGSTMVIAGSNFIHIWGWNAQCEVRCEAPSGFVFQKRWRTSGQQQEEAHQLSECFGARTILLRGGGRCGSCVFNRDAVSATQPLFLSHLPPPAPPHPPERAPSPPPPWSPPHYRPVENSWLLPPLVLFVLFMLAQITLRNAVHRRRRREQQIRAQIMAQNSLRHLAMVDWELELRARHDSQPVPEVVHGVPVTEPSSVVIATPAGAEEEGAEDDDGSSSVSGMEGQRPALVGVATVTGRPVVSIV